MTTKISTIYDALVSVVGGVITTYKRIPNPYFIDENNQLLLAKGFGIGVGSGTRRDLEVCKLAWNRIFTVVLVQQITTTDNNVNDRIDIEKAMLEDHFAIIRAIESASTLNGNDIKADVLGDSGMQFLTGDRLKYLSISIDINILYQETYS